ncbi:MAG: hypothetical protein DRI97_17055 [Bacteroidetes bacterium]|nr:MAG: hypothetical protein DRI97_17055 [Bacteroidota bacterium]
MKTKMLVPLILIIIAAAVVIGFVSSKSEKPDKRFQVPEVEKTSALGVCPPFYLLTEEGDTINPMKGLNIDKPYSPRQTCGKCHDYNLITEGYHFQQGKGEKPLDIQSERMQWVSSPGNYGGPWCSPAPLYRYLSDKENVQAAMVDMTSFDFVVSCGVCHPGGGSLELDREGLRYDKVMADENKGFSPGGLNNLDGDYHKAKWSESGVIEADCNICHLPEYNNTERKRQIKSMNFKWAATAGSGFGKVTGSVLNNEEVILAYYKENFNPDGTLEPHLVKEPRNEACLWCHAKPGWKKRGANFRARTDVHLSAGLKCVDCHVAGMSADNDLIRGKEVHQFGKGDDPGGHVRDDLDNTMRTCTDCHNNGILGAPLAKHAWLPPLHLEKIACQTCHIPERTVKSAYFVASDVFNPGAKIPTKGKHLWTFYDPNMNYWNHYGDLEMMGYDDKPTFSFKPELVKYKNMIYPANRVHTAWPAIQTNGEPGLMQPRMGDIYKMWIAHFKNPASYAALSRIVDDNNDQVIEVNSPEEIDALIASVTEKLMEINYPLEGKHVVWVMNNRVYQSGNEYTELPMEPWEASPYGNVHTYNHDIFPAKSALGKNGCTDCHSYNADFFMAPVVKYPFDGNGVTVTAPQYASLGISAVQAKTGIIRESYLKPVLYILLLLSLVFILIAVIRHFLTDLLPSSWLNALCLLSLAGVVFMLAWILPDEQLSSYMLPARSWLDANHFGMGVLILLGTLATLLVSIRHSPGEGRSIMGKPYTLKLFLLIILVLTGVSGLLMLVGGNWIFYTLFDLELILAIASSIMMLAPFYFQPGKTELSEVQ